jgi:hypothetical protein
LRTTEANLNRVGGLSHYRFELIPYDDTQFNLVVFSGSTLKPKSGWLRRLLPMARGLPYQTVFFDLSNAGPHAITLHSMFRWDSDKRRAWIQFSGPVSLNPRLKYRLSADAREENWDLRRTYSARPGGLDGLILRKVEAGGELQYGVTNRLDWISGVSVATRGFRNADALDIFKSGWSTHWENAFAYRLLDIPERRLRVDSRSALEVGRYWKGTPARTVRVDGRVDARWFPHSKGDDLVVAGRARGGKIFDAVRFDDLYILGIERDNDLWMRGHRGSIDGRKGAAPLGTEYALFQAEADRTMWRFPLVRIQLGPFLDIGRTGDPAGNFGSRGWMYDAGVQAKLRLLGSINWTFVYGRNLRDGGGVFYTTVSR